MYQPGLVSTGLDLSGEEDFPGALHYERTFILLLRGSFGTVSGQRSFGLEIPLRRVVQSSFITVQPQRTKKSGTEPSNSEAFWMLLYSTYTARPCAYCTRLPVRDVAVLYLARAHHSTSVMQVLYQTALPHHITITSRSIEEGPRDSVRYSVGILAPFPDYRISRLFTLLARRCVDLRPSCRISAL